MTDKIFATISMLAVVVFCGVATVGVMEPDLWIVTVVVLAIGIFDFIRSFREQKTEDSE